MTEYIITERGYKKRAIPKIGKDLSGRQRKKLKKATQREEKAKLRLEKK
jgi:hypothetical protein